MWIVAVHVPKNPSRTAENGWPPAWGLGMEVTPPGPKRKSMLQNVIQGLGLGRILWSRSALLSLLRGASKFGKI